MKKLVSLLALAALFQLLVSTALAQATLHGVGDLPGGAVSSDLRAAIKWEGVLIGVGGSAANGMSPDTGFVWTSTGGITAIPNLVTNTTAIGPVFASAITPNGAYIASRSRSVSSGENRHAVRVTRSGLTSTDLGVIGSHTQFSAATGISSDGSILFGFARYEAGGKNKAVRYNFGTLTIDEIPFLNGGDDSSAPAGRAVSANGHVMIGTSTNTGVDGNDFYGAGNRAFRYELGVGVTAIPLLPGGTWSVAVALTTDGNRALVVGESAGAPQGEAYIRNSAINKTIRLGTPNGSWRANNLGGISADGSVVALSWIDGNTPKFPGIHNAAGWHDLTDLATRAGVDLTGWSLRNITGLSPDATLVWGTGMHNGNTEGWILEFPAGYLAAAEEPVPASTPASSIVGTWLLGDPSADGSTVLVFFPDGYYAHIQVPTAEEQDTGAAGFERGQYSWNASTGAFTFKTLLDTNGDIGLSGDSGATDWTITVSGDTLTVNIPDEEGPVQLTRLNETGQPPIIGTFGTMSYGNSSVAAVFLPGGIYFLLEDGNTDGDESGYDGLERGTFTWDPVTGVFSATPNVDDNGEWGLSHPDNPTTVITFPGDGNTLYLDGEPVVQRVRASTTVADDFDGDGRTDTLWRNSNTGDISSWPSAGGYKSFGREGSGWSFIDRGDFDGDGQVDTLWRNSNNGTIASWASTDGYTIFGVEGSGWGYIDRGDFDGDGKVDTLWRNSNTGEISSWPSAGGYLRFGVEGSGWGYIDRGDFDGDGQVDTLWRNSNNGTIATWPSAGGYTVFGAEGGGWAYIDQDDFDGDGKADTLWRNSNTGDISSWPSAGGYKSFGREGSGWSYIAKADFDGDGKVDTLWRDANTGYIVTWPSAGTYTIFGSESGGWTCIDTGDYDGDGRADTLWRNSNNGEIATWPSTDGYLSYGLEGGGWTYVPNTD
jgi:hypothetical protein